MRQPAPPLAICVSRVRHDNRRWAGHKKAGPLLISTKHRGSSRRQALAPLLFCRIGEGHILPCVCEDRRLLEWQGTCSKGRSSESRAGPNQLRNRLSGAGSVNARPRCGRGVTCTVKPHLARVAVSRPSSAPRARRWWSHWRSRVRCGRRTLPLLSEQCQSRSDDLLYGTDDFGEELIGNNLFWLFR